MITNASTSITKKCMSRDLPIDKFNKKAWHYITSYFVNAIQICVGKKDWENQRRANIFEVFLSTVTSSNHYLNTNLVDIYTLRILGIY